MKRKLIWIPLLFVLGIGLYAALFIEGFVGEQLIQLLDGEIKTANAACRLQVEKLDVSLLRLTARAENAAMICGDTRKLLVREITASFSLSEILNRRIILSELNLIDGEIDGVSPKGEVYQFIYYLAAPIPPDRDTPDRWGLNLLELNVRNTSFVQRLGERTLIGEGGYLELRQDVKDQVILQPGFKRLALLGKGDPPLEIGELSAKLVAGDTSTIIEQLELLHQEAWARVAGRYNDTDDTIDAKATYGFNSRYLPLPAWLSFAVTGDARLSGDIDAPRLCGSVTGGLSIESDEPTLTTFDEVRADYCTDFAETPLTVRIPNAGALNATLSIDATAPFVLKEGTLSGEAALKAKSFRLGEIELKNISISTALKGPIAAPQVEFSSTLGELPVTNDLVLKDVAIRGHYEGEAITFDIQNQAPFGGGVSARGVLNLAQMDRPLLQDVAFEAHEVRVPVGEKSALVDGAGAVSGPLVAEELLGAAHASVAIDSFVDSRQLLVDAKLEKGTIEFKMRDQETSFSGELTAPVSGDKKAFLRASASDRVLQAFIPQNACVRFQADLSYTFTFDKVFEGEGGISLPFVEAGCGEDAIAVAAPVTVPIRRGTLLIQDVRLKSHGTSLLVNGVISRPRGFDLRAEGELGLEGFLPLFPALDDLGGDVQVRLAVNGPFDNPLFNGSVTLIGGHASLEAAGISANSVHGRLLLEGEKLVLSDFKGELNGGSFSLKGFVAPLSIENSSVEFSGRGVVIESLENAILILDADMRASTSEQGRLGVEGVIQIESGQYQKNVDVQGIARLVTGYIFGSKARFEANQKKLPDVDLKLKVQGARNIFVFTNFFGAELGVDLSVNGKLAEPALSGKIETVSAWFGLRNRRFVVTNGALIFSPLMLEPQLELIGETKLYSATGNPVSVMLEAKGLVTRPVIELSSDQGLSEDEILALLASGQGATNPTLADKVGRELEEKAGISLTGLLPFLPLPGLLDELTRIDNLYFEPELNPATGLVEPVAIAEKDITDRLAAVGKIGLGGKNASRASIVYDLTPKLNIAGVLDTGTLEQRTSLGVDLGYTVLSRLGQAVRLKLQGNSEFSTAEIFKALKLNEAVNIKTGDVQSVVAGLKEFYVKKGYRQASVEADCKAEGEFCSSLTLHISEGTPCTIEEVVYTGDNPSQVLGGKMPRFKAGEVASAEYLDQSRAELVNALRNEGYISARIEARYEDGSNPSLVKLVFRCVLGRPVTFHFEGNTSFTARDFLNTINLFKRRIPFGRNTINLLVENMEMLYRREGYLHVAIRKSEEFDYQSGRIIYTVSITEGERVRVADVVIEGNEAVSLSQIKAAFESTGGREFDDMFSPDVAVPENIKAHAEFLRTYYVNEGFPEAAVQTDLRPVDEGKKVQIVYKVREGVSFKRDWVVFRNVPDDVELPAKPRGQYSIAKANEYIREVLRRTEAAAYLSPSFYSIARDASGPIEIYLVPGPKARIEGIRFEGEDRVSENVLKTAVVVKKGDAWSQRAISQSKLKLLKLGLFSSVEVKEEGGEGGAPRTVVFKVREKPMQTLQLGGGLYSEYGVHAFGEGSDRGLFKDGRVLSLRLDGYYDEVRANVSQGSATLRYLDPAFWNTDVSFTEDLRYVKQSLTTQEFNLDRISLTSSFYRSNPQGLTLTAGHTIMQENLSDVSPDAILSSLDTGIVDLSLLGTSLRYDRRDSALAPTKGYLITLDSAIASHYIASDADYYMVNGRVSWLHPLRLFNERLIFAAATGMGGGWTYGDTADIPITQRFYAGGRTSVRGYGENSLGPRGFRGSVIGGDVLSVSNVQLNYLFAEDFSVHTFLDAGNVYLKQRGVDLGDQRFGSGVGFEYRSPIGPIGFDLGFPLDKSTNDSPYRVYFTVGTLF